MPDHSFRSTSTPPQCNQWCWAYQRTHQDQTPSIQEKRENQPKEYSIFKSPGVIWNPQEFISYTLIQPGSFDGTLPLLVNKVQRGGNEVWSIFALSDIDGQSKLIICSGAHVKHHPQLQLFRLDCHLVQGILFVGQPFCS